MDEQITGRILREGHEASVRRYPFKTGGLDLGSNETLWLGHGVRERLVPPAGFSRDILLLDEFALILRLDDVYWSEEGRISVELVAVTIACLGMLPSRDIRCTMAAVWQSTLVREHGEQSTDDEAPRNARVQLR